MLHAAVIRDPGGGARSCWGWWCGIFAVMLLAGCIAESAHPQPDFPGDAIIEPETLETSFEDEVPQLGDERTSPIEADGLDVMEQPLVGESSRSVPAIRRGLAVANSMLVPGLELLNRIVRENEPILSDDDVTVWRVREGGTIITFYLEEDEQEAGRYNYFLVGRRGNDPLSTSRVILSGFFKPGPRTADGRQTGEGVLSYEYTQIQALAPGLSNATGVGSVGFRVTENRKDLLLYFFNYRPMDEMDPLNARYSYNLRPEGGRLSFTLLYDAIPELRGSEVLDTVAGWDAQGSGRARSILSSPIVDGELMLDECWDGNQNQVWTRWAPTVPDGEANDGSIEACGVFADADFQVVNTSPVAPDEVPEIPSE